MKKDIIRTEDLYVGSRVTLWCWQTDNYNTETLTKRSGTVIEIRRNGQMYVIRMDKGYTECWHHKELFLSMNKIIPYTGYHSDITDAQVRELISQDPTTVEEMSAKRTHIQQVGEYPGGISGWRLDMSKVTKLQGEVKHA